MPNTCGKCQRSVNTQGCWTFLRSKPENGKILNKSKALTGSQRWLCQERFWCMIVSIRWQTMLWCHKSQLCLPSFWRQTYIKISLDVGALIEEIHLTQHSLCFLLLQMIWLFCLLPDESSSQIASSPKHRSKQLWCHYVMPSKFKEISRNQIYQQFGENRIFHQISWKSLH